VRASLRPSHPPPSAPSASVRDQRVTSPTLGVVDEQRGQTPDPSAGEPGDPPGVPTKVTVARVRVPSSAPTRSPDREALLVPLARPGLRQVHKRVLQCAARPVTGDARVYGAPARPRPPSSRSERSVGGTTHNAVVNVVNAAISTSLRIYTLGTLVGRSRLQWRQVVGGTREEITLKCGPTDEA
jgi:hypothetical protein